MTWRMVAGGVIAAALILPGVLVVGFVLGAGLLVGLEFAGRLLPLLAQTL